VPGGLLPGGVLDATGRAQRDFDLAVLTGREEELLAHTRRLSPAAAVTEVLSRCVRRIGTISPVPPEVVRELLVADRHYLLLQLRRQTFGDGVRADLICPWPECGEQVTLQFSINDVPIEAPASVAARHTLQPAGGSPAEIEFRLPNGGDQEALAGMLAENEAAALTALLARCVRRIDDDLHPAQERIAALPAAVRAEIESRMAAAAPKVGQTMDVRCPECGRMFVAPFDIQRFFLGELRTDGAQLYREVHYLAYHYHWAEGEIMAMTRDKRHMYIDVLAETIGALNDGA